MVAGADRRGLAQQPGRRPLGVAAMRAWHVLGDRRVPVRPRVAQMAGNPVFRVEQLDGLVGDARLDYLAHQPIGHRVEVAVDLDVVVEPRPAAPPLRVGIGLGGRASRAPRSIASNKARREVPRWRMGRWFRSATSSRIAPFNSAREKNRRCRSLRQHPALHHLDGDLDLGLVARACARGRAGSPCRNGWPCPGRSG